MKCDKCGREMVSFFFSGYHGYNPMTGYQCPVCDLGAHLGGIGGHGADGNISAVFEEVSCIGGRDRTVKTLFALAESVRDCANWARQKEDKPDGMVADLERAAKIIEQFDIFIKEARG